MRTVVEESAARAYADQIARVNRIRKVTPINPRGRTTGWRVGLDLNANHHTHD
jgi:hypothetical protein